MKKTEQYGEEKRLVRRRKETHTCGCMWALKDKRLYSAHRKGRKAELTQAEDAQYVEEDTNDVCVTVTKQGFSIRGRSITLI